MPDFDNVDLAIIGAVIIAVVFGGMLVFKGHITEGLGLGTTAITAITGLAGKKSNGKE